MFHALTDMGQRLLRQASTGDAVPLTSRRSHPSGTPRPDSVSNGPLPVALARQATAHVWVPTDPSGAYAVTEQEGRLLGDLLRHSHRALDPDYRQPLEDDAEQALQAFYARRTRLLSDALGDPGTAPLPTRTQGVPALSGCSTSWDVLEQLLKGAPGLVIGSAGTNGVAEQLLIDNMNVLFQLGVRTLYLGGLMHDLHQKDIDLMHATGRTPIDLSRFLGDLGTGQGTLAAVVDKADRVGVRVVALDTMVSRHLKGASHPDGQWMDPADIRARAFTHVAEARIRHDLSTQPETAAPHRWIALMFNTAAGIYNGHPGVAARLGVASLRVEEAPSGRFSRLRAGFDPGLSASHQVLSVGGELQCDHLLKLPRPGVQAPSVPTPEPCSAAVAGQARQARQIRAAMDLCARDLVIPGSFRVIPIGEDGQVLVHRSSSGLLVAQRIEATRDGGVRLKLAPEADPVRWHHVQRTFPSLDALRTALSTRMEEVPRQVPVRLLR